MSNSFKFSELQPAERDTFELPDGFLIEFRNRNDLSARQMARLSRMQHEFENLQKAFASPDLSDAVVERKATKMHDLFGEFVTIILPEMPDDVLETLTTGQRVQIVNWWNGEQAKKGAAAPELNGVASTVTG